MLISIQITNKKQSGVSDSDLRATTTAVLCKAIMEGRHIPALVIINLRPNTILTEYKGKPVARTAELRIDTQGLATITICYANRPAPHIINSLVHELCHLIRACNNEFVVDNLDQEEIENYQEILRIYPAVSWISSLLVSDSRGELQIIDDYSQTQPSPDSSAEVREGNTGAGVRLQVSPAAS